MTAEPGTQGTGTARQTPLLLGMGWFPDQAGGLNRYFRELVRALRARGVQPWAVVVGPIADPAFPQVVAVAGNGTSIVSRLARFGRCATRLGAHASVVDAHFALYALLPTILGRLRKVPLVVHFQGPWADESASAGESRAWILTVKRLVEAVVYRHARAAIVLSGAFKRILVERYGVEPWRVHVVEPGVDLDYFRPASRPEARTALDIPAAAWVTLAVRRLVPRMGLDVLIQAWRDVAAGHDNSLLLIVGEGPAGGDLESLAGEAGVAGTVRFLGAVTDEDLLSCYRAADVCVVPSVALEGFGLVVLESLACGTPVVATDTGGLPEALSRLDGTLIVPAGNAPALAARLQAGRSKTLPFPGREECRTFAEHFSWDVAASRTLGIYQSVKGPSSSKRKVRVVYLDHCAGLSGGEIALARLLPALVDVEPHVVLAEDGPLVERLVRAGISLQLMPMRESARDLRRDKVRPGRRSLTAAVATGIYVARLTRLLRRLRPDIVHTNSLKSAVYGGFAGRLARVPVIWHVRDRIAPDYLPRSAVRLVRALARCLPQAVIANSRTTLETLPQSMPDVAAVVSDAVSLGAHSAVIPSPVVMNPSRASRSAAARGQHLRVGLVGRLAPWKGQHVFLRAFAAAFPDGGAKAVVVGMPLFGELDYEQELQEIADSLGIRERVEFHGFVEDVAMQLERLDILVHASIIPEPFGQVVIEGMAAGLPVVAARAGGPAEVIEDGVDGILYTLGDVGALADALRELAGQPGLRERLGKAGRMKAAGFTPEIVAAQVVRVYRSLLAGTAR